MTRNNPLNSEDIAMTAPLKKREVIPIDRSRRHYDEVEDALVRPAWTAAEDERVPNEYSRRIGIEIFIRHRR